MSSQFHLYEAQRVDDGGKMQATLGLDFGSNSVRALLVNCANGQELGTGVVEYASGAQGILLDPADPNLARQHPGDYLLALEQSVAIALSFARQHLTFAPTRVIGIGVDTTGSSPLPVDAQNRPLALDPAWRDNLAAQCWLWKDHTSYAEAAEITQLAAKRRPHYIAKCGSVYSSEWFWAKILHCRRTAPAVFAAAFSWVELADFIPSVLAGIDDPRAIRRGICAAGHKALYAEAWGGLPDAEFLAALDPELARLRERLYTQAFDASYPAGNLAPVWAEKLGLPAGIPIAIGAFDVHYGAIGCGVAEGVLVKAIGTSTCDCAVVDAKKNIADIPGICGIVPGAILPGYFGIEAGQSAVGDIFQWFIGTICQGDAGLHARLATEAATLAAGQSGLLALDWNNGNRTILVDPRLTGLLLGQTLYTTRAEIYRALIEATAFGARAIIERIEEYGVPVQRVVCCGGVAEKNSLLMQIYADVLGRPMELAGSAQACALGSALVAAVLAGPAAGGHASFTEAQQNMTRRRETVYLPHPANQRVYHRLYALYRQLHDSFGGVAPGADLGRLMKELIALRTPLPQDSAPTSPSPNEAKAPLL